MFRRFRLQSDTLAFAIVLWLCALPLVGILVLPVLGRATGLMAAGALFVVALAICWGICSWMFLDDREHL